MATNANWTIIFEDKIITKQSGDAANTSYIISDDSFWSDPKFSNVWAIQHGTSITSDEVENRDSTPHSSFADANNNEVDEDNNSTETEAEKIARLGARPTSYTS